MKESLHLGIDFGTSNSAVGRLVDDHVDLVDLHNGKKTQPSSLFIRVDGYHSTGYQAVEDFLNPEIKNTAYHFIPSVKLGLPLESYEGNLLRSNKIVDGRYQSKFFPVEDLASYVISDLKKKAEDQNQREFHKVVLGRPVTFSEDHKLDQLAQDRLKEAATISGFKDIYFIQEPIAAALYYERTRLGREQKRVFVFDFGGGTLDTCVLNLVPNQKIDEVSLRSRVVSSHGINLGGTDLDKVIFGKLFMPYFGSQVTFDKQSLPMPSYLHHNLPDWHLSNQFNNPDILGMLRRISNDTYISDKDAVERLITLIKDQQIFALLNNIEDAKIVLSEKDTTKVLHQYLNINLDYPLSRQEFEDLVDSKRKEAEHCISECLHKAQLRPEDIDLVLRVGGSSCNPFAEQMLKKIFDKVEDTEPLTSVVAGLSLAASEIF